MTSASRKARIVVEGASLVGLSLAAFLVRLTWFLTTDEPTGWDGYAFVVQVERLITEGRLHWPDASWVTYFLAVLHLLLPSAILAVKVGGCLLAAAVVPSAWWLGRALERGLPVPWLPWALASWAAASPTLTHLAGDFPKNLGAVAPLLVALGWSGGRRGIGPFVAALLLAAFAHRLGAALLLVSGAGALSAALLSRTSVRTGLLLGLGAAVVFILASVTLPGLLHPADLERLESQLSFSPRALPPWPYFSLRDTRWPERLELLLAWPALLVGVWTAWTSPLLRLRVSALLAPLVVCVFPLWRTDVLDVGYRLALMAPAFAVPLLLLAAATWAQRGGEPRRRESQPSPGGAPEGQRASAAVPGPEDGGAARLDEAGQKSSGAVAPPAPSEGGCVRGDAPPEVARAAAKVATLGAGSMSHGEVPPEGTRAAAKVTTLGAESMSHGEVPPEGTRAAAKVATGGAGSMSRGDVPSERGSALGEESTASARAGALLPVRATALGLLLTALAARSGFDVSQTPPYAVWRTVIARIPRPLPALLIAPQGFNFLYDHETGHEALAWSPEASIDRTTTYRLVWGVTDGEWLEFAPDAEPPPERLGADVVYVREDVWEAFLARAQADGDAELLRRLSDWRNPLRVRPRSLVRNR